jgi:hypothetical protein
MQFLRHTLQKVVGVGQQALSRKAQQAQFTAIPSRLASPRRCRIGDRSASLNG